MPKINPDTVPSTIEEAVTLLIEGIQENEREFISTHPPEAVHFFGGMAMRNSWSLWEKETPIKRDAVETYKIAHADDLSGLIMAWVWAKVRNEAFDPVAYCELFHTHWRQFQMTSLQAGGYHNDGTPITQEGH